MTRLLRIRKAASALLLVGVLVMMTGVATTAAKAPVPFTAVAFVAVTAIDDVNPAGLSGRVRIGAEALTGMVLSSTDPRLAPVVVPEIGPVPKLVDMAQKSNELFTADPRFDPTARAVTGNSHGTFTISDPLLGGSEIVSGQYSLRVSSTPECQIYDEGHWSTTGGNLKGRGTVTACLNYDEDYDTFTGPVILTGTLN